MPPDVAHKVISQSHDETSDETLTVCFVATAVMASYFLLPLPTLFPMEHADGIKMYRKRVSMHNWRRMEYWVLIAHASFPPFIQKENICVSCQTEDNSFSASQVPVLLLLRG